MIEIQHDLPIDSASLRFNTVWKLTLSNHSKPIKNHRNPPELSDPVRHHHSSSPERAKGARRQRDAERSRDRGAAQGVAWRSMA